MITLREFKQEDTSDLVQILNNANVTKFLSAKIPTPYTEQDAQWWITTGSQIGITRAIEYQGQLVGCISVDRGEFEYSRSGELGYWIAQDYWRKGIATRAINEFTSYIFENTDIVRVFAAVFSANTPSANVLKKCGYSLEAIHKQAMFKSNKFYDNHIYCKLKIPDADVA
ncbi:GNAT family N-acetyltransferase [Thalassotalea fusca]